MRNSIVKTINTNSLHFSSSLRIGDTKYLTPLSIALAIQQEGAYFTREVQRRHTFMNYDFFTDPLPEHLADYQPNITRNNKGDIKVGHINVIGATASSTIHIGSIKHGDAVSRVKHIRHLLDTDEE
ncbi:spore germination protein GerPE [Alkalibacillus haloalkaliphilus]|uniref:spore germination protein GerPE n=1 Tax=Alkalibacillus haloalkaliphilus TaxID=94136 RepID=UPI0003098634|nr:spore germination protein GerPE [Alkalibacillus haloalkaliphilus]